MVTVIIENKSDIAVENIYLFNSYINRTVEHYGIDKNIGISSRFDKTYLSILADTESLNRTISKLSIDSTDKEQLSPTITIHHIDEVGYECKQIVEFKDGKILKVIRSIIPSPEILRNGKINSKKPIEKIMPSPHDDIAPFVLDGFTKIIVSKLLPKNKMVIILEVVPKVSDILKVPTAE